MLDCTISFSLWWAMVKMAVYTQKCEQKWLKINNRGLGIKMSWVEKNRRINNQGEEGGQLFGTREYFLLNSRFSIKMVFLRKLKSIYPSTYQDYNNCSAPTFLVLFRKFLVPSLFKKEGRNCILYQRPQRRDNKIITILYDRCFIYRTVKL